MKKKFGKLTIKEVQQLCENQDHHGGCINCPIYNMCPRRFNSPDDWKECLNGRPIIILNWKEIRK